MVNAFRKNQKIPSREQSGIGISNVKERLYLIYGDRSKLDVHNRECGGVSDNRNSVQLSGAGIGNQQCAGRIGRTEYLKTKGHSENKHLPECPFNIYLK